MKHYQEVSRINFPQFNGLMINMMPVIVGDIDSLPDELKSYHSIINQTRLEQGSLAYLTVRESIITSNAPQSRGGIHVEAPKLNAWGGGAWGGISFDKGVYMASTDGACNVWDELAHDRDHQGACSVSTVPEKMKESMLYWITDKTPHQALPSAVGTQRQFFRLVSDEISVWYSQHNTKNPKGIMPNCEIVDYNKFLH